MVRRPALTFSMALMLLGAAQAQQPQHPIIPMQDGGVDEVLQSIVVPPMPHAPFSATLDTEWVRYTGEGATITWVNERHIARSYDGIVYEERWLLVPKDSGIKSRMNLIQIADPVQKTIYECYVFRHVCHLDWYDPMAELAAATEKPWQPGAGPIGNGRGYTQVENLGTKMIDGVDTHGQRVTTTYYVDTMGNNQPVDAIRETWRSDELAMNLVSIRSGPIIGKQTFTVRDLSVGPPDPAMFTVPKGFRVVDERGSTTSPQ